MVSIIITHSKYCTASYCAVITIIMVFRTWYLSSIEYLKSSPALYTYTFSIWFSTFSYELMQYFCGYMVEFCINCAFNSPFSFIWFYLHPRPHIWHIKPICDINEEKILKIAIFDILVVLSIWPDIDIGNCLWQLLADWKIKNFCCHTKTLWSIITLSNVAVSFTIIRACVYQIWGLGCKWFKSYDRKRDFTLFWKLTGSFCTAVLRKIRLCYWLAKKG